MGGSEVRRFEDLRSDGSEVRGFGTRRFDTSTFGDSEIRRFGGLEIRRLEVQRFRGSEIWRFENLGLGGSTPRPSEIRRLEVRRFRGSMVWRFGDSKLEIWRSMNGPLLETKRRNDVILQHRLGERRKFAYNPKQLPRPLDDNMDISLVESCH